MYDIYLLPDYCFDVCTDQDAPTDEEAEEASLFAETPADDFEPEPWVDCKTIAMLRSQGRIYEVSR